jgi:uncharacterized protein YbbK (DUF523 family)
VTLLAYGELGLRKATPEAPLRVLLSGCLAGWKCGVDGTDNGVSFVALPNVRLFPFCPEEHAMGTPRTTPDIDGGDGVDVLAGRATVRDEHGADLTAAMIEGAKAMLAFARANDVELALLTDMSAACGSQVISLGSRFAMPRRYQKGVGVATALLLEAGIPALSQRDFRTLERLRAHLDPTHVPNADARDHHEHAWTLEHLPERHVRARSRP